MCANCSPARAVTGSCVRAELLLTPAAWSEGLVVSWPACEGRMVYRQLGLHRFNLPFTARNPSPGSANIPPDPQGRARDSKK